MPAPAGPSSRLSIGPPVHKRFIRMNEAARWALAKLSNLSIKVTSAT